MMAFLVALPFEYDYVRAQILSSPEISSFRETFIRIFRMEISSHALPFAQMSSALVGQNNGESGKPQYRYSDAGGNTRRPNFGGIVCYYCCKTRCKTPSR